MGCFSLNKKKKKKKKKYFFFFFFFFFIFFFIFFFFFFFFNDTATTEIYTSLHTLSLHDALPIYLAGPVRGALGRRRSLDPARAAGGRALRGSRAPHRRDDGGAGGELRRAAGPRHQPRQAGEDRGGRQRVRPRDRAGRHPARG